MLSYLQAEGEKKNEEKRTKPQRPGGTIPRYIIIRLSKDKDRESWKQ